MIDIIVKCAQNFFDGPIFKNKVTRDRNVTQGYAWRFHDSRSRLASFLNTRD